MRLQEVRRKGKNSLGGNWGLAIGVLILASIIPLVPMYTITPMFRGIHGNVELGLDQLIRIFLAAPLTAGAKWIFLGFYDGHKQSLGNLFGAFKNYWRVVGVTFLRGLFASLWALAPLIPAMIVGIIMIALATTLQSVVLVVMGMLVIILPSSIASMIATYSYSQALFLVKDHPTIDVMNAITESKQLMKGNKWHYFKLQLFFTLLNLPGIVLVVVSFGFLIHALEPIITNPGLLDLLMRGFFDMSMFNEASLGLFGLFAFLGAIYLLAMSFYVGPYRNAANASFYREIKPTSTNHVGTSNEEVNNIITINKGTAVNSTDSFQDDFSFEAPRFESPQEEFGFSNTNQNSSNSNSFLDSFGSTDQN